ncbi:MAG: hypothetical protein ACT4P7_11870 [Gemmatimonadaceae bacterium]
MTDDREQLTPQEAAAALDSIGELTRAALKRGLHSRWFAVLLSSWVGAMTCAKAYDDPVADGIIAALLVAGVLGFALRSRRIVARVRAVHGVIGAVAALALTVSVLVILALGDRAFEVYDLPWAPFATGGVAAVLFMAFEVERRATRAKFAAGDA